MSHRCRLWEVSEKTSLLAPGEEEVLSITIPWKELAVYEEERAAWVLEKGEYALRVGNSSQNMVCGKFMQTEQDYVLEQCENRLMLASCNCGKLKFLTKDKKTDGTTKIADVIEEADTVKKGDQQKKTAEVHNCKVQTRKLSEFSIEELAALCVGYWTWNSFCSSQEI